MTAQTPAINFLGRFRSQVILTAKRQLIIQTFCMVVLILYGMGLLGVFAYELHLQFQVRKIKAAIEHEMSSLEPLLDFETKYGVLKRKTQALIAIRKSSQQHQQLVEGLLRLFPEGLLVNSFSIKEGGEINFNAQTTDPRMMRRFMNNLARKEIPEIGMVTLAEVTDITVDVNGLYNMGIVLQIQLTQS